ncbi:hypothetical protein [Bacillus sp. AFS040349]|uniref:hypothetical protein n=1 Tax=Bacillus sp. AFS040349 TaxID=2033502 RepID=UPI000BFD2B2B|nr:hypothetical protein [Bacillus sp. AFS040349]PGT80584.1 hypothetical protein COD11_20960 [Bacillus sp. AFS040349]
MEKPFIAKKQTYVNGGTTFSVYHPAIKFDGDKEYCYFPDEGTRTGLVEHLDENECLKNAETLYKHYILDKR